MLAEDVAKQWQTFEQTLLPERGWRSGRQIGVVGIGHSLGGKLLVCLEGRPELKQRIGKRLGNVMMAFNNYGVTKMMGGMSKTISGVTEVMQGLGLNKDLLNRSGMQNVDVKGLFDIARGRGRSIVEGFAGKEAGERVDDIVDKVLKVTDTATSGKEFTPSPIETETIVEKEYGVRNNLVVRFANDQIDESQGLVRRLRNKLGEQGVVYRELPGTHVTPHTPGIDPQNMRKVGYETVDQAVQRTYEQASRVLKQLVTVVAAFLKLQLELSAGKGQT